MDGLLPGCSLWDTMNTLQLSRLPKHLGEILYLDGQQCPSDEAFTTERTHVRNNRNLSD